jgi:3',5'-cyclic AMP phosphodiesterase CpdA
VTVVPGNHDVYVRLLRDPGIARWSPWMTGDGGGGGFPFVRRRGAVAIVALSSAVPMPVFMASGRLGPTQIDAAARALRALQREGLARVVLIHHPPLPGLAKRARGLDDAALVAAMLAREGAELVLFGHNHRAIRTTAAGPAGPIPVIGVPSASAAPPFHHPPARYNLFRIERRSGGFRIEMTGRQVAADGARMVEAERIVLAE